ncbi:GNAT family N-acetyltransferase [Arenivirga flava]|uniref:GCN5 family N-acetyltransferase n=1 Tax=Arenivirga flava TaxID=1930060 RepID=A0AA37UGF2_9MICO|nr:GNAT family N-acetyltransferase [Arenivirga flava]GMA28855.1 GCN5 family N-acetyltransferase [Arenivirga flava]
MRVVVRAATPADVPMIAALLTSSLSDDPFFRPLLPEGPQRLTGAVRFFAAYALTHLGRDRALDVACADDGRVLGVAAWTYRPEGRSSLASRQTGRSVHYVRAIGVRKILRALRLRQEIEHRRPFGTHWWLSAIAVDESARRLGVGSALLTHRLALIDAAHEAAYVEATSDTAVALCECFRFLPQATQGGNAGYPMQAMSREPTRPMHRYD